MTIVPLFEGDANSHKKAQEAFERRSPHVLVSFQTFFAPLRMHLSWCTNAVRVWSTSTVRSLTTVYR